MERTLLAALSLASFCGCQPAAPSGGGSGREPAPPIANDASVPDPGSSDAGLAECAAVTMEAEPTLRPVDIIWVVDSSGSMSNEAARVQENMNRFASDVLGAGIDPHVVVITSPSYVTVPPPLGDDVEHYRFVECNVGSHAPLEKLVEQFPMYADFLRADAVTHIVAVTDDESNMDASEFDSRMTALLGHSYVLHAIASEDVGGHECDGAANVGRQYYELAATTMGLQISICTSDWTGVFDCLREHIFATAPLPCEFAVPDPPEGMVLDAERVEVEFTSSVGATRTIPRVEAMAACAGDGWFWDDPIAPEMIHLCPGACAEVGSDHGGRVAISLGCQTLLR